MRAITQLLKSKRGISTAVGAALAILILITLFNGVYLWTASVQQSMSQLDKDKMDESITVYATFNYLEGGDVDVSLQVENNGIIDVELTRVWIIDEENNDHEHIDVSYSLPQGNSIFFTKEVNELVEKLGSFDVTTTTYYFKVVTARGNMASSMLVPTAALETSYPMAIISEASHIKNEDSSSTLHLVVWNSLDYEIITSIVVTGSVTQNGNSETLSDVINITERVWTLFARRIAEETFSNIVSDVIRLSVGKLIRVELVNLSGQIVAACYFVVEGAS